ncbi:RES family NAD+ phosphorylase [Derxia lacustris]|uniref:RES family NAD+ phosphorylase n=1 Tax=Derxia lacustris TaxID=764842 RepID=UPI000A1703CD|nr:RES family NAD+ phosphorylase [Derxia lacustris]
MKPHDLKSLSITTFPAGQMLARIQRRHATDGSSRVNGLFLPPIDDQPKGRFDLAHKPSCYLAETAETAVYEALARREASHLALATLKDRELVTVKTLRALAVADLRPHARPYPVLQSLRYAETQELALSIHNQGCDGILYRSAQQAGADCWVLFGDAIRACKVTRRALLAEPVTGGLHRVIVEALHGSRIPLVP